MNFRSAVACLLVAAVSAKSFTPEGSIDASSKLGSTLLSKAKVVTESRHLNNNGERDVTFIASYSLKYLGCSSLTQVNQEGNGDEGLLYQQNLVRFALCPANSCSSCSGGGEYVVNMYDFVNAYTEAKLTEQEYKCEQIRENCYNDDENGCYAQAGANECIEYEGQEVFEIQEYLECKEMEDNNGNNNNNNNQGGYYNGVYYGDLFVGMYCNPKDNKSINLGVFYDETCSSHASLSLYGERNYGATLPFSSRSDPIVVTECLSCEDVDNDNNNNNNNNNGNYYQAEPNELCMELYEQSARCESNMNIQYADSSGCEFINRILPRLESASNSFSRRGGAGTGSTARTFAWLFGITTAVLGGYSYFLYRKIKRGSVSLSSSDGQVA